MNTAEEILKDIFIASNPKLNAEGGWEIFKKRDPDVLKFLTDSMKNYASQALDIAAEEAKVSIQVLPEQVVDTRQQIEVECTDMTKYTISVDRDSILGIKERLK